MCTTAKQNKLLVKHLDLLITKRNWKQRKVANDLDIPPTTLSRIITGNRKPNKDHLCKISYFLIQQQVFIEKD